MDWVNTGAVGDIAFSNHSTVGVTVRSTGKAHHILSQANCSLHSRRVKGLVHMTVWGAWWPNNDCSDLEMGFALVHPLPRTQAGAQSLIGDIFFFFGWLTVNPPCQQKVWVTVHCTNVCKEGKGWGEWQAGRKKGKHNKNNLEYKWIKVTNQLI